MSEVISTPEVSRDAQSLRSAERRALVVEDDLAIRLLVSAVLRREGFVVDPAVNGREALALLGDRTYAVIVLDLTMPEIDGVQLLESLRRRDERMLRRVVVMTAAVHRARPELPPEICHVLTKPFDLADFYAAITSCAADADA
jgi:CheY-like chemotaxis protein